MLIVLIDTAYLGDLVLATPLIRAAAEHAAGGTIDVVTSPAGASVLRGNPFVRDLLVYDKRRSGRGLAGLRAVSTWIRERNPHLALLPRRSFRSILLARLAGVPRRIGFLRGASRWLLTDRVPFDQGLHQVERNLELLRPLGIDPATCGRKGHPLEVFPGDDDRAEVDAWLDQRGLSRSGAFFAIAPGSVWATKRWPLERFAATAGALTGRRPVVVIGGPAETGLARELLAAVPEQQRHHVHDATGRFTPGGSVHLLSLAAVLISNDSGALHLGQAAATPVVGLFGPTAPSLGYAPRGDQHVLVERHDLACRPCGRHGAARCPEKHWRCMLDLSVGQVLDAVARVAREAA